MWPVHGFLKRVNTLADELCKFFELAGLPKWRDEANSPWFYASRGLKEQ
jgi:hypothetical protein